MTSYPASHVEDSLKLIADGIVDLFQIQLVEGGTVYIKNNNTVTYLGNTYEGIAVKLSGVGNSSGDDKARPSLDVANPEGVFSALVGQGKLEGAVVVRIRVLYTHLINNTNINMQQSWTVNKVSSLNRSSISLELRNTLDGSYFKLPARVFAPPEFPMVSLS